MELLVVIGFLYLILCFMIRISRFLYNNYYPGLVFFFGGGGYMYCMYVAGVLLRYCKGKAGSDRWAMAHPCIIESLINKTYSLLKLKL